MEILNSIFPDNRRTILQKPSFLVEAGTYVHETELLTARKLRIIEKKIIAERGQILTVFIRRLLKMSLMLIRTNKDYREAATPQLIYCIVQVCY